MGAAVRRRSVPVSGQVEVDEHEQILARVAAIDIAKASGMVCTRVPHDTQAGKRLTKVWEVRSTTTAILELGDQLAGQGIERVVVESTSDYWRPFVYLLEACGLTVWLVSARDVKHLPGRPKTDKLDAVWLARLNERGMLRPSFVPPAQIRRLRDLTRLRADLTADRSRHKQRLEKLLEDALIKLSTVATDIFGVSGRAMLEAMIAGQRDPRTLAELARGRLRVKYTALLEALTGQFSDHHARLARILLDQIDTLSGQIDQLTALIEETIAAIPAAHAPIAAPGSGPTDGVQDPGPVPLPAVARLDEVTGIGIHTAQVIIAEVGLDMGQFPTPGHLVAWAKLAPRSIQSGAKQRSGKTGKGNPYLKGALGEAAAAAAKTDTFLGERYRRLVRRRGKLKALVAVARSILVIVWHLLADPTARFHDLGASFYATRVNKDRKTRSLVHQLEALGHKVILQPAAA
jgi:transposase